jgi:ankyrin repeat protein
VNIRSREVTVLIKALLHVLQVIKYKSMTPLHYAADRGQVDLVRLLLEHGADVTALDDDGQTAMDVAETCEHQVTICSFHVVVY